VKPSRRLKYETQWALVRAGVFALRLLPLRPRSWLLSAAARFAGTFVFGGISRRNLKIAFGNELPREMRREIRRSNARAVGRMAAEWIDYIHDGAATARRAVEVDNTLAHLEAALARRRGVVVVTPHFGNWELMPAYLVARGFGGAVVAREPANPRLAKWLVDARARAGVQTLDALGHPRAILKVLQSGAIVGLLPDLDSKYAAGEFIEFFGRPAWTPTGPAHLAVLSGAPIVPAYMIPRDRGYLLTFDEAILPDPEAGKRAEITRLTTAWSRRFEARIRAHPEHWVWMHDRFATTPEKIAERRARRLRDLASKPSAP
jgi:KDO2-lipid IV(A) lauroyltransferase